MNSKKILVTGGTGSFGKKFIDTCLKKYNPDKIIVYSRDEMKQWEMSNSYPGENRLRYFIGDVRDKERLNRALSDVDIVIHAAATKIVPTAEYNPFECIKTNIHGAMNVIDCSIDQNVPRVIALSTDKASSPINLYGATKLCADKLMIAANSYVGKKDVRFSVVRYGNVMGSRGSVIPYFKSIDEKAEIPVTHPDMTRFMISLEEAVGLVLFAIDDMLGGEIYIKKIPSMNIMDIAKACNPDAKTKITGIRPGEKLHEQMIGIEDAPYTYEYDDYYKILPALFDLYLDKKRIKNGIKVPADFCYVSDKNKNYMSIDNLRNWISENLAVLGKF